jgi:hypothetical protein
VRNHKKTRVGVCIVWTNRDIKMSAFTSIRVVVQMADILGFFFKFLLINDVAESRNTWLFCFGSFLRFSRRTCFLAFLSGTTESTFP